MTSPFDNVTPLLQSWLLKSFFLSPPVQKLGYSIFMIRLNFLVEGPKSATSEGTTVRTPRVEELWETITAVLTQI
jgi:hypothetical protein